MYFIMLGGPGSGKGTTSDKLSKEYNIKHISTGDMLREEIKKESIIGEQIKETLEDGKLVSDDIVIDIIKNKLLSKEYEKGAILDGFPRTKNQAIKLSEILTSFGKKVNIAINLDISDEIIIQRTVNRQLCSNKNCGAIYNSKFSPSKVTGICDKCGSKLIKRTDDNEKTVQKRLNVYHKQAKDIIEFYKETGVLYTIKLNEKTKPKELINKISNYLNQNITNIKEE